MTAPTPRPAARALVVCGIPLQRNESEQLREVYRGSRGCLSVTVWEDFTSRRWHAYAVAYFEVSCGRMGWNLDGLSADTAEAAAELLGELLRAATKDLAGLEVDP